jgi:hypothetical protein
MKEDIIRMAREAGGGTTWWPLHTDTLERFTALVAAAEREACAKVADLVAREMDDTNGIATYIAAALRARG